MKAQPVKVQPAQGARLRLRTLACLAAVGGALGALAACQHYEPDLGGQAFVIQGAHFDLSCEQCHGPPPFAAFTWDTTCLSCHEQDRKQDPNGHYPGQACSGDGCHADTDQTWSDALGGVNHDFLPLEGTHAIGCESCHSEASPSANDVFPAGATSELCWTCHEDDRDNVATGTGTTAVVTDYHYVEEELDVPADAERRWDCKACHDVQSRNGTPINNWTFAGQHGGIRFPHAMQTGPQNAQIALPQTAWVVACEDCHLEALGGVPFYSCTTNCHQNVVGSNPYHGTLQGNPATDDVRCGNAACHPAADNILR